MRLSKTQNREIPRSGEQSNLGMRSSRRIQVLRIFFICLCGFWFSCVGAFGELFQFGASSCDRTFQTLTFRTGNNWRQVLGTIVNVQINSG